MEKSRGGSNIYRYESEGRQSSEGAVPADPQDRIKIREHIEKNIGPIIATYGEDTSKFVSLSLHVVDSTKEWGCYTVVTSGMSDLPMRTPEKCEAFRFGELMINLPVDWPMDPAAWEDLNHGWPIHLLKSLARFPHERHSWLFAMHTIPNGNPPAAYADSTRVSACLIDFPPSPERVHELKVSEKKVVHFHSVIPIHEDELNFTLEYGLDALTACFARAGFTRIVDPSRPSVLESLPRLPGDRPSGGRK